MKKADIFHPPLPERPDTTLYWHTPHGASIGLLLESAIEESDHPLLIIAPDNLFVSRLIDELNLFKKNTYPILLFPDWETLPYDYFSPHQDIISERLEALYHLPNLKKGALITTISTLLHPLPPPSFLGGHSFLIKTGDELNIDILKTKLIKAGYYHAAQVKTHGEFALRGSIIDLYPMGHPTPFRIDLFDNTVDSIRIFSEETQRSLEQISEIRLLPAKEFPLTEEGIEFFKSNFRSEFSGDPLQSVIYQDISEGIGSPGIEYYLPLFFESTVHLFDYLPQNASIVLIDDWQQKINEFWHETNLRYEKSRYDRTRPMLPPEKLFLKEDQLNEIIKSYSKIEIRPDAFARYYNFETDPAPALEINYKAEEPLNDLKNFIEQQEGKVLFCAESIGRREILLQLFKKILFIPQPAASWQGFLNSAQPFCITIAPIEDGFVLKDHHITVLAETQLYGKRVMQRRLRKKTSSVNVDALIRDLTELKINDPVVHIDHGIGRYMGLKTLHIGNQISEFVCLSYQDEATLYVPIASLNLISRYAGRDADHAPIAKLGTQQWQKNKKKAFNKIKDVAAELLELYAKRASQKGFQYVLPEEHYQAFASQFPFEETPDQQQAIDQVILDMTSNRPMDRVICGDVGFGKTEVALRASFIAVENSKQVAILVPTTLLAQQHFQNFQDRFAEWPVTVDVLSRFRTAKEQKLILEKIENGKIDVIIGTHALLQKSVRFKSLGLVIIDEEHRFGVKQKEKLKTLRTAVDILTLTATPIPRTLNMSLAGIRDLSIIATPPVKRLSVKTFVHEYQDHLIHEAIQREIMRGGQVYFLHNDIDTIQKKTEDLKKSSPEIRIAYAHGQMHERELERIMADFYHRRFNVLVSSTIIESGIDVPTANTIIINRSDKLGLAQLHQLRGRVGRSHHQAYAYLLTPPKQMITKEAVKRLEAIAAFDDLGVGFTLATQDLEIRGAGELLGEDQSGNIEEIGFTLYMDMLSRTIDALKEGQTIHLDQITTPSQTEIDLHLEALIPDTYLNDIPLRLQFYKKISNSKDENDLNQIQVEMIDRFGLLPNALKNLFVITEIKLKASSIGISKIDVNERIGKIEFNDKPNIKPEVILEMIQAPESVYQLDGPKRLKFKLKEHEPIQRIQLISGILNRLGK